MVSVDGAESTNRRGWVRAAAAAALVLSVLDGSRAAGDPPGAEAAPTAPARVPEVDWSPDEFSGPAYDDWLLGDPFRLVPRARSQVVRRYPRGTPLQGGFPGRRLLLTFDDGPFPETTPRLLEILAREKVHAVFFVVAGRVDETPLRRNGRRMVQQIIAGGHVVGNHSFNHPHLVSLAEEGWRQQIQRAHAAIFSAIDYAPTLFRPPYGHFNGAIDRYLTYRGYTRVHWTYVADEFRGRSPEVMTRGIMEQFAERERLGRNLGGILLLHDSHERSVDCAGVLIRRLKAENCTLLDAGDDDIWRFVDVGEFFQPAGQGGDESTTASSLPAAPAVLEEARRWCEEHAGELDEIRRLDDIQVNINEDGFGSVAGHDPPDEGTTEP
ncbi:MAG: polysaccharide deacetylase family protein [Deltaproteobacteria bacterium]|nr:polysaccharide deacetylase family protein [Deltaproteobacteria bacterium]